MNKKVKQNLGFLLLFLCILTTVIFLGLILYFIIIRGFSVLSYEFLTQVPKKSMTAGGVAPAIVGTFYLTLGAMIFSIPLGVACAIYLSEYSPQSFIINIIRISINNLADRKSVV